MVTVPCGSGWVKLLGLDVFDPITMEPHHAAGDDVPCWMLDTAYNGMVFHVDQVFFPKTSARDSLRKALKATHDEAVWQHLAGDTSAPFAAAVGSDIAVKVIDERGNELRSSAVQLSSPQHWRPMLAKALTASSGYPRFAAGGERRGTHTPMVRA